MYTYHDDRPQSCHGDGLDPYGLELRTDSVVSTQLLLTSHLFSSPISRMVSDCGAPDIIPLILPATIGFTATASGWPVAQVNLFVNQVSVKPRLYIWLPINYVHGIA